MAIVDLFHGNMGFVPFNRGVGSFLVFFRFARSVFSRWHAVELLEHTVEVVDILDPDPVVRVTGFTAYFASLSPKFRQLVVDRFLYGVS